MIIPARRIYALTQDEAMAISRWGGTWGVWHAIGQRLGVEFKPESGPVPIVERTGWLSIAVTWTPRKCRKPPAEVDLTQVFFTMPRFQGRL